MSAVYADTSALLALQVPSDKYHPRAASCWEGLKRGHTPLLTTSYVLTEAYVLLGRRSGDLAARNFRSYLEPLLQVAWVDAPLHQAGLSLWLDEGRATSLVDAVSFVVMRRERIDQAWTYDTDFESAGFTLLP